MTWIKICGTTNLEDAQMCVEAGADALGFIFAESPRKIGTELAFGVISKLPQNIEKVGVFVSETPEAMKSAVASCGLTAIQLHSQEAASHIGLLSNHAKVIQAVAAEFFRGPGGIWFDQDGLRTLYGLLFDAGTNNVKGGTGKAWNWESFAERIALFNGMTKTIVAGGLTPENVGEAIRILRPWGVDVVSGVEREPGKKDPKKVKAFIEAVRRADNELASP